MHRNVVQLVGNPHFRFKVSKISLEFYVSIYYCMLTFLCEPHVSIIWPQTQPELSSTGEHPVWFIGTKCSEIIYEHSNITLSPVNGKGRLLLHLCCSIDSSYNTLEILKWKTNDVASQVAPKYTANAAVAKMTSSLGL
jgi:hypothetical protein